MKLEGITHTLSAPCCSPCLGQDAVFAQELLAMRCFCLTQLLHAIVEFYRKLAHLQVLHKE